MFGKKVFHPQCPWGKRPRGRPSKQGGFRRVKALAEYHLITLEVDLGGAHQFEGAGRPPDPETSAEKRSNEKMEL